VNGILAWLSTQAGIALGVVDAIVSNKSAPARQVVIYTVVLAGLAFVIPKIIKLVSK
jgi:hypothetical protein